MLLAACQEDPTPATLPPVSAGRIVVVGEHETVPFDLHSGDTLTLVMLFDQGMTERCDDYGGILAYDEVTPRWLCVDVDF